MFSHISNTRNELIKMGKKKVSGNARRKEKEMREYVSVNGEAFLEARSSSPLWNGLVLHHKDVFVSHVLPKLNRTDRGFFSKVNLESWGVLKYAGVDVSELGVVVYECASISTLEWAWNDMDWGWEDDKGIVINQAWFCEQVAGTNKLELLKWAREVKQCQWDEWTINASARTGNLEMLKKSRAFKLFMEDTSTMFDFFSTK